VYNVVGPHPARMEEFGKMLATVISRPYWLPTPAFALKLLLGEMSTLILDGQRAVPVRLLESGYSYYYPDLRPALENLFG
jgi:NAD dependent epimerase/dehydratase family enzyme